MIRVGITVEGPTEEEFIKRVLAEPLAERAIVATPVSMEGNVTIQRLVREMSILSWNFDCVSSFVDFYGFRDKQDLTVDQLERKVDLLLRQRIGHRYNESKVFVYVQRHEFEGLLFSDLDGFRGVNLAVNDVHLDRLWNIRRRFRTPEDINDNSETAPSKRLVRVFPNYSKRLHGPLVAARIGLPRIRAECPRFADWLGRVERLAL